MRAILLRMIKKSLKYLAIVFVNLIILRILLEVWTDKFELEFNDLVRLTEFLKLIGISIVGLILLRFTVSLYRSLKIISTKRKIGVSIFLILIINSFFYFDYGKRIYFNQFVNNELRSGVMEKLKPLEDGNSYGSKADSLTGKEYAEITKIKWFPKLPKSAENISYNYSYYGFLPDYSFSLSYDLPKKSEIDTMNYVDGTFSKSRGFEIVGDKKRVTYSEGQW